MTAAPRPIELFRCTRESPVSLGEMQRAAGVPGCENRLNRIARGEISAGVLTERQRAAIRRIARGLGLAGRDCFAPLDADEFDRLRRRPPLHARFGGGPLRAQLLATDGADPRRGRLMFTRFTHPNWDHWKSNEESTTMLPADCLEYWGLERDPFDRVQRDEDLLSYAGAERVRRDLAAAVRSGEHAWLIGPSGAGKTVAARSVIDQLQRSDRLAVARVRTPNCSRAPEPSLCTAMLIDFADAAGRRPSGHGNIERQLRQLASLIRELRLQRRPALLVVEEAHCLTDALIRYMRRLQESLSGEGLGPQSLSILLIGQNDASARAVGRSMDDMLADPALREVTRRVVPIHVSPMAPQTVNRYIEHRIASAGGSVEEIYAAGWERATTQALPRDLRVPQAVNTLHARALTLAARMNDDLVSPQHIDDAARYTPGSEEDS